MTDIQLEANKMVDHLASGNLPAISAMYQYPAAVYFGEHVLVLKNEEELLQALGLYRTILSKHGLSFVLTNILQHPDLESDRFIVEVANRYIDNRNWEFGSSRIRYFVQRELGCAKIRMVEYLDWPCGNALKENREFMAMCQRGMMATPKSDASSINGQYLN